MTASSQDAAIRSDLQQLSACTRVEGGGAAHEEAGTELVARMRMPTLGGTREPAKRVGVTAVARQRGSELELGRDIAGARALSQCSVQLSWHPADFASFYTLLNSIHGVRL